MTSSDFDLQRLRDIEDNLTKEQGLLKQFEDTLRYETDPRIKARYQRDIERLKNTIIQYQQEYLKLRNQLPNAAQVDVENLNIANQNLSPQRTILFLAASLTDMAGLRLTQEIREIDEGLRLSKQRNNFILEQRLATRTEDLRRALLQYQPQIVHFCGHGETDGIFLENDAGTKQLVPKEALSNLFKLFSKRGVQCVFLNACYSDEQAEEISEHINFVVGMSRAVGDKAAIQFAVGFYDALGAGWSYEDAYELGCNAISLEGIPEELTPVLSCYAFKL